MTRKAHRKITAQCPEHEAVARIERWHNVERLTYKEIAERFDTSTRTLSRFINTHFELECLLKPRKIITIQARKS